MWVHSPLDPYAVVDKDEDGKADEEMDFNDEFREDTGDGETFEGGYDYPDDNYDGYGDGAFDDYDGVDFQ
ncbi:hypothetical protein E2562_020052 [Oryza meyeriana var. granulata]|uniref:Uncharacterized protein n=1 Tax=Oryza meyeriana var. granulata TaxID=110450 RepID=A0A6G1BZX4_9ORYZ|nr:hypothetical protein E2562_020052 [Oryza meyeriana var. granulata]